jgi:hypothetical protein
MAWRKWLIRAVVFSVVGSAASAAWLFQFWTNPEAVRSQVLQRMKEMFPGAVVTLDRARLRLLGGIDLYDLRLARGDDKERRDFAHFQSATLFHDKESLSQGQLVIRKIELDRPRLRLVRERDGRWNLDGLFKPAQGQAVLPTVVIHAGTIVLEDRQPNGAAPTIELNDVNLKLLNDTSAVVTVEANGKSDVAERVQVIARWQRETHELTINCTVQGAPLNTELVHRFGPYVPAAVADGLDVQGLLSGQADLHVHLDGATTPHYKVSATLNRGKIIHPKLPLDLDEVHAKVHCEDGRLTVEQATARSGEAMIEGSGTTLLPNPEKNYQATLSVNRLAVNKRLLERLPESYQKIRDLFQPNGPATLRIDCECRDGQHTNQHCYIHPKRMNALYKNFPYPIDGIQGELAYDLLKAALKIDLKAELAGQPITLKGTWIGQREETDADVHIQGANIPLDERLLSALPKEHQPAARSFHASGMADFDIHVRRAPHQHFTNHYQVRFHHGAMKWDHFKYKLGQVSGVLDIFPDHWEFNKFEGTNGRGLVKVSGRSQRTHQAEPTSPDAPAEHRFQVCVVGQNVDLNEELYNALQPQQGMTAVWDTFQPTGRVDFRADIDHVTGGTKRRFADDIALLVNLRDGTATPRFYRVPVKDVQGIFLYDKNRVKMWNVKGAHKAGSRAELTYGTVDLYPSAGYFADLSGFRGEPLVFNEEMLDALPEHARKALQTLQIKEQPFQVKAERLVIAQPAGPNQPPEVFWDGECQLKDTKLNLGLAVDNVTGKVACRGRHDGKKFEAVFGNVAWQKAELLKQPFHDIQSHFYVLKERPDTVMLDLKAPIFGGELSGQGKVELGPQGVYDLNLTASQVKLEEFARHNLRDQAQWKGLAEGRLHIFGRAGSPESLEGNGSIDVRTGKLYNLPFLLDLLKFLGFRWPDRTMFEEAHAVFALKGKRVTVNRLDLLGNVISFWGRGEVNADGSDVQLDFYPTWGRLDQVLPPVVRNIPPTISKMLVKIEARGRLSGNSEDLHFSQRLVPPLFDPILQLGDRWGGTERSQK